jgi:23S rRNA (cytidine2498-2'-O)-methyltransferase
MSDAPRFVFAVCQAGAERALKTEVAARHAGLRFAYSRPGLVTWKTDAPIDPAFELGAVFARVWGAALGGAATPDEALALVDAGAAPGRLRLHVFARDPWRPDEAPPEAAAELARAADDWRARLHALAPARWLEGDRAAAGELVVDVIVPVEPDERAWVGLHRHGPGRWPSPGGRAPLSEPPGAPSRAWRKLEEALVWSGLAPGRGQVAVELGSAPGGATAALLARGVEVWGVDPGDMDPAIVARPGFHHLKTTLGDVRLEALPARVDWLLMDVNLAPQVALHGVRRFVAAWRRELRGAVLTLKLNDWKMAAELPALIERVRAMGLADARATQLPSNRQEVCVVARAATSPARSARSRPSRRR